MLEASERAADFRSMFDDERRFRAWYDTTLPVVLGFVYGRCAADAALAQDITQEAFVEAVRSRQSFDGRADPVTWLCGIARHRIADHYRREARERRRQLELVRETDHEPDPAEAVDTRDSVERALHHLPLDQQRALVLHYLDGLAVREIARQLHRSEGAVESLLARGRDGFRRELAEAGGDARA